MLNFTEEQIRVSEIFFPFMHSRVDYMLSTQKRFVHYTDAQAVVGILKSKQVWMRKSNVMNDYMEITHGLECIQTAFGGKSGQEFKMLVDGLFPDLMAELDAEFSGLVPDFRSETYLTCISEHEDAEDQLGRLSMWRAYGGPTRVAIVLNPSVMLSQSDALKAYSSPVAYLSTEQFGREFDQLIQRMSASSDFLKALGRKKIARYIFEMLRYGALCTKHPGFHEEREWRIIYSPKFERSSRILKQYEIIRGVPQPVCKIPLEDVPDEGLVNVAIPQLVNRIIVGPSIFALTVKDTFLELLEESGMEDAASKIVLSDIPLRTHQ